MAKHRVPILILASGFWDLGLSGLEVTEIMKKLFFHRALP